MNASLNDLVAKTASETLENLAFVFSFPKTESDAPPETAGAVLCKIGFSGPFSGVLDMSITEGCLAELAANMLGIDEEEISAEQKADAVKEVINVICGNLLPAVAGTRALFDLDAPETTDELTESIGRGLQPAARAFLELEEGTCALRLSVDSPDLLAALHEPGVGIETGGRVQP